MKRAVISLVLVIGLAICLQGCGTIRSGIDYSSLGSCQKNALSVGEALKGSFEIRYGHGYFKGKKHMWCEFKDPTDGMWHMAKDTIWYINAGYPIQAYKSGSKYDYRVDWYGYPDSKPDYRNEKMLYNLGVLAYFNE